MEFPEIQPFMKLPLEPWAAELLTPWDCMPEVLGGLLNFPSQLYKALRKLELMLC